MSKTECKRCGGEGMGQHSRANGMCYLCGRMPGEGHAVKVIVAPADARWRSIENIRVMLKNATIEHEAGELSAWLFDEDSYGESAMRTLFGLVTTAPADVAARARAAFARLGVTIPESMPPRALPTARRAA